MSGYYMTSNDEQFLDLITDELNKYNSSNDTSLCVSLFIFDNICVSEIYLLFSLQYSSFSTFNITSSIAIASTSRKKIFESIQFFGW
jgi:hypothetical protein